MLSKMTEWNPNVQNSIPEALLSVLTPDTIEETNSQLNQYFGNYHYQTNFPNPNYPSQSLTSKPLEDDLHDRIALLGIPHSYSNVEDLVTDLKAVAADPHQPIKARHRLQAHQTEILTKAFSIDPNPDTAYRSSLAAELNMNEREVQVWFQNRRAKIKREGSVLNTTDTTQTQLTLKKQKLKRNKRIRPLSTSSGSIKSYHSSTDISNDSNHDSANEVLGDLGQGMMPLLFPTSTESESYHVPFGWNLNPGLVSLPPQPTPTLYEWDYERFMQHFNTCPYLHHSVSNFQSLLYSDQPVTPTISTPFPHQVYLFDSDTNFLG